MNKKNTKTIAAMLILVGGGFALQANAATYLSPSFVQASSASYGCTNCASDVTSTLNSVVAGDLLMMGFGQSTLGTSTFTDSNGTPIFLASTTWHTNSESWWYYEPNAAAGTHNIHVHFPIEQSYPGVFVEEYGKSATSSPIDTFRIGIGNSGSTAGSGNLSSTAQMNEVVYAAGASAGGSLSAPSGYTMRDSSANVMDNATSSLAQGTVTSGTFNYSGGGIDWAVLAATIKGQATSSSATSTPDALLFAGD